MFDLDEFDKQYIKSTIVWLITITVICGIIFLLCSIGCLCSFYKSIVCILLLSLCLRTYLCGQVAVLVNHYR